MNARLLFALAAVCAGAYGQTPCERLKSLSLPRMAITGAESLPEQAPVQAHCRVAAVLRPSADSEIGIELWLPAAPDWNGKFEAVGNGAWAGVFSTAAMEGALREGYATASTDTGHKERDG